MKSLWVWIAGSIGGFFLFFRRLIFLQLRLGKRDTNVLFTLLRGEKAHKIVLFEEITDAPTPGIYQALAWIGLPLYIKAEERLMQAGFVGTDSATSVTLPRWSRKKLLTLLEANRVVENETGVYVLQPWDVQKVGELVTPKGGMVKPYVPASLLERAEEEVHRALSENTKTGILTHGSPGNGKSYLARYLAQKFGMSIYILSLMPETTNQDLIRMFGRIKGPALILIEDFDSYFNGRKCLMEDAKFTFDTILNVLDGTFATLQNVVVYMTANDVAKVDPAIRLRPSRFQLVEPMDNPGMEVIDRIKQDYPLAKSLEPRTGGQSSLRSLDDILTAAQREQSTKTV